MNEPQIDNGIRGFFQYTLPDMMAKISQLSAIMNDSTTQIKILSTIILQPPSRADIIEKINNNRQTFSDELDKVVVKRLDERDKDYENINKIIGQFNIVVTKLSEQIDDNAKILVSLNTKVNIALQVAAAVIVIIPIIWGIFEFASKIAVHK